MKKATPCVRGPITTAGPTKDGAPASLPGSTAEAVIMAAGIAMRARA